MLPWRPIINSEFQPTRPLRGATEYIGSAAGDIAISTHAPLAGRDITYQLDRWSNNTFQPTRPLRGATQRYKLHFLHHSYFNPRAPCGARPGDAGGADNGRHFNPRAPCGARLRGSLYKYGASTISTHAPLAGRD